MKAVLALLLICLIKLSLGVRCLQQQTESIKVVTQIMKGHDIWYNTFMWPGKNVTLESIAMDSNNVTFLYWLDNISSWFYYFKSVGIVKCVSLRLIKFEIEIEFVVMTSWSSCSNASLHCQEISPILLFGNTTKTFLFSIQEEREDSANDTSSVGNLLLPRYLLQCEECLFSQLKSCLFGTNARGAIWWPNLELIQVAPPGGQIWN